MFARRPPAVGRDQFIPDRDVEPLCLLQSAAGGGETEWGDRDDTTCSNSYRRGRRLACFRGASIVERRRLFLRSHARRGRPRRARPRRYLPAAPGVRRGEVERYSPGHRRQGKLRRKEAQNRGREARQVLRSPAVAGGIAEGRECVLTFVLDS